MAISSQQLQMTRQVFLWFLATTYLFSFGSLYIQIPGLYGERGLTPVRLVLPTDNSSSIQQHIEQFIQFPSLLTQHARLGLSPSVAMEIVCVAGALLALLAIVFRAARSCLVFTALFLLYLSLQKVGQVFLWFQWDSLLLETGFLAIVLAPLNLLPWRKPTPKAHDGMTLWLVRWLLFRLMFASGVVKLQSQCTTWWGLTALNHHFESQCIPTPLAWYAHHLPSWILRLGVVGTYLIESVTPIFFFVPVRGLRMLGAFSQIILQLAIIATGNYNFFNLLTITLSVSLLDDQTLGGRTSVSSLSNRLSRAVFGSSGYLVLSAVRVLTSLSVVGLVLGLTVYYFNINLIDWTLTSQIRFSPEDLEGAMTTIVPLLVVMGALSLAIEVLGSIMSSLMETGLLSKLWSLTQTVFFTLVVVTMFIVSVPSFSVLDRSFHNTVPPQILSLHNSADHFSLTSSYGLFRRMTGVEGRPEVIIEGSNDQEHWKEYNFLYKPGHLSQPPPFVAPHQPRLDWQMWFAALGGYQGNPWLVHLAYKLLLGEEDVLRLMAPPPFTTPPAFVRAQLYTYHYTEYNHKRPFYNQTSLWWQRSLKGDYLFALSLNNTNLLEFVSSHFPAPQDERKSETLVTNTLAQLRGYSNSYPPTTILWALFVTALVVMVTIRLLLPD